MYKPRGLALDRHLSNLLAEIPGLHPDIALRRLRVLDRGEYGWVECIEAAPCADPADVERFYRRAGALTCLAYVLGGSDLHAGNLIACGDQPVPIDLECMTGAPLASPHRGADPAQRVSPPGSVLRTGLPPAARNGAGNAFHIAGGLADPDPRQAAGALGRVREYRPDGVASPLPPVANRNRTRRCSTTAGRAHRPTWSR